MIMIQLANEVGGGGHFWKTVVKYDPSMVLWGN